MDTKPIRELIDAAKEMEAWNGPGSAASLGAKCETLGEAESRFRSAIAAAERALADENDAALSFVSGMESGI